MIFHFFSSADEYEVHRAYQNKPIMNVEIQANIFCFVYVFFFSSW